MRSVGFLARAPSNISCAESTAEGRSASPASQLVPQPGTSEAPIGFDGREADVHQLGDFMVLESAEEAVLDDLGWTRPDPFQPLETLVHGG